MFPSDVEQIWDNKRQTGFVAQEYLAAPTFWEFYGLPAGCLKGRIGGG